MKFKWVFQPSKGERKSLRSFSLNCKTKWVDTDFQLVQIQKFNINKEQILLYCLKIQTQTQASSDYTTVWFPPGIWSERGFTALKSVPVQEQGALDPFRCTEGTDERTARQCSDTFRSDNGKFFFLTSIGITPRALWVVLWNMYERLFSTFLSLTSFPGPFPVPEAGERDNLGPGMSHS